MQLAEAVMLTPEDPREIATAIERTGAGTGSVRPADGAARDRVVSRE
jgi:hypothetical protein